MPSSWYHSTSSPVSFEKNRFDWSRRHVWTTCLFGYPTQTVPQVVMHYGLCRLIATANAITNMIPWPSQGIQPLNVFFRAWCWWVARSPFIRCICSFSFKDMSFVDSWCDLHTVSLSRDGFHTRLTLSANIKRTTTRCSSMVQALSGASIRLALCHITVWWIAASR